MNEAFQSDYKNRGPRWAGSVNLPSLPAGSRILETGCGNGKTLSAFHDVSCLGIDISSEAVKLAGHNKALCGDIRALPFHDASFDFVFCWHVLGHLKEKDRFIAAEEIKRVTKSGGRIFFKGFSTADFRNGKGSLKEPNSFLRGDGIMTHYFDETELLELFGNGDIKEETWNMRIRGVTYTRSELTGTFAVID